MRERLHFGLAVSLCGHYDWGTTEEIFTIADKMVRDHDYRPYSHIDMSDPKMTDSEKEYKTRAQVGGACSTVQKVLEIHGSLTPKED